MFKKSLAIMLVGSMLVSSAPAVMAAESEATSSVTSAVESVAENTESTATEEGDDVDFGALVDTMISEIEKAAAEVDLEKKEEVLGKEFSEDGTVFSIIENILNDIQERFTADGTEVGDALTQAIEAFSNLSEADEAKLDILLEDVFGTDSDEVEDESQDFDLEIANAIADFVFEAAKENEQIAEAVEATGSKLFELLSDSDEEEISIVELLSEEPFEDFEEELAKVTDHINEQEGPKQAALDLLNLVHEIVDNIHSALHGHGHRMIVD
jgi:hypothetical protein